MEKIIISLIGMGICLPISIFTIIITLKLKKMNMGTYTLLALIFMMSGLMFAAFLIIYLAESGIADRLMEVIEVI